MSRRAFLEELRTVAQQLRSGHNTCDNTPLTAVDFDPPPPRPRSWLTPQVVAEFDPEDFSGLPNDKIEELRREVEKFRAIAKSGNSKKPVPNDKMHSATLHIRRVIEIAREPEVAEWKTAVEELAEKVAGWARELGWRVEPDIKTLSDWFLGEYQVPGLLLNRADGRVLLDPIERYFFGTDGLVELCVLPSCESAWIVRFDGKWHFQSKRPEGRSKRWTKSLFREILGKLLAVA